MGDKTKIEWADATWNPATGCTRASVGCDNCYAASMSKRLEAMGSKGYEHGFTPAEHPERLSIPGRWKRPRKIFVCSMGDLFHHDISFEFIAEIFNVMARTERHTYQVLTKRPQRMLDFFEWIGGEAYPLPKNIWIGVTAENQETANERIPLLMQCPAAVRFVSCEPLLSSVNLTRAMYGANPMGMSCFGFTDGYGYEALIDWVICGGETGNQARPMHPDWAIDLRDQCVAADVPFMFKQWGEWGNGGTDDTRIKCKTVLRDGRSCLSPAELGYSGYLVQEWSALGACVMSKVGKKKSGRELDGTIWNEFPEKKEG